MAVALHPHRSHPHAPPRTWIDQDQDGGVLETIAVVALRVAALVLVGYLGAIM